MAKNSITDYSKTASLNTDIQSVDIDEGCLPSGINNAIREIMADLAAVNDGTVSLTSPSFAAASLTGNLSFGDNDKAIFGAGSDLQIYHDGSNSIISDQGTGNLKLLANDFRLANAANNELMISANQSGSVDLRYAGGVKLATTSTGIDVTGTVTATSISVGDSHTIGNDGFDNLEITSSTSENIVLKPAGSVYLYNANAPKLATTSTGIDVTGTVTADGGEFTGDVTFGDSNKAIFGAGSDLQIYHDGLSSIISDQGTGNLNLQTNGARLNIQGTGSGSTKTMAAFVDGGTVQLNHNGNQKLATKATGIDVTGTVTADGLTVDTNTLHVDSTNNRVGIGTTSPEHALSVFKDSNGNRTEIGIDNIDQRLVLGAYFESGVAQYSAIQATNNSENTATNLTLQPDGGNVGIGTISPSGRLDISSTSIPYTNIVTTNPTGVASGITMLASVSGGEEFIAYRNAMRFGTATGVNAAGFAERMRIDSSGNVNINDTAGSGDKVFVLGKVRASQGFKMDGGTEIIPPASETMAFKTNNSERMRINSSGQLLSNTTFANIYDNSGSGGGFVSSATFNAMNGVGDGALYLNRVVSDGIVVYILQDGSIEGSISVSGTTVSYNGGHLARWSQLTDSTKDETIVKGTVMTNLDQMAVWSHDAVEAKDAVLDDDGNIVTDAIEAKDAYIEENEQLNCMAVSSVEGDPNVAGVFVNWDNDDDQFNDMNIAMTGDMVIRIAQNVTVQRGDLLMSAGDGTAKPQEDDIVRSKTIAKVTSTNVSHTYDDGSYCVPCVLMAC